MGGRGEDWLEGKVIKTSHILMFKDLIASVTHMRISIYNRISKTENSTFERIMRV